VVTLREGLWKAGPYKPLTVGLRKTGGRNNQGRITVWHRGGGSKRLYRQVPPPPHDAQWLPASCAQPGRPRRSALKARVAGVRELPRHG